MFFYGWRESARKSVTWLLSGDGCFTSRLTAFWRESSLNTGRAIHWAAVVPGNSGLAPADLRENLCRGGWGLLLHQERRREELAVKRPRPLTWNSPAAPAQLTRSDKQEHTNEDTKQAHLKHIFQERKMHMIQLKTAEQISRWSFVLPGMNF